MIAQPSFLSGTEEQHAFFYMIALHGQHGAYSSWCSTCRFTSRTKSSFSTQPLHDAPALRRISFSWATRSFVKSVLASSFTVAEHFLPPLHKTNPAQPHQPVSQGRQPPALPCRPSFP